MLVHICCSVDSHFFLQKLRLLYPQKKLIGFFYNPNIHPYSEYKLRLFDVQRSCDKLDIELIEGEYDLVGWLEAIRGLENEPERADRCRVCFDDRLKTTAKKAIELGINEITTTLLTSPKKSIEQLKKNALQVEQKYSLHVDTPDFKVGGGVMEQLALAKKDMLYHQNYCGCLFALEKQRESQDRLKDELMSSAVAQVLPSSIEERIGLYERVVECERRGEKFRLKREKFLNYRLLSASVKDSKKEVIFSYFLFYSTLKRGRTKGKIELIQDGIGYFNREEILIISIKKLNSVLKCSYKNVNALIKRPLQVEDEIVLRKRLESGVFQTLNPIIVIDNIELKKYEIKLISKTYSDVREVLVKIG